MTDVVEKTLPAAPEPEGAPGGRRVRFRMTRMLLSSWRTRVALGILLLVIAASIVGPMVSPYGVNEQVLSDRLEPPSGSHLLGTDSLGRDVLTLVLAGTWLSVVAGLLAVLTAVILGVPSGLLAGYRGGVFGTMSNAASDTLLSLPPLILALAIVGAYGGGVTAAMLAVGVTMAPRFYRVSRGVASSVSQESYVEAARSIGSSTFRILTRHVFTNAVAPLLVQVSFSIGLAIIAEASLSFLGLGAQPPQVSLGTMARDAFTHIRESPFGIFPPCVMIAIIVYLFASLGDSLRDSLVSGGKR
ncbi:ABC transporter permease [Rhodococcus erythropolis]|uniref:ABC transporter permease n=1 Tax=Rhodococcus erythropolis TaxID=1833 RepID=UPI0037A01EAA